MVRRESKIHCVIFSEYLFWRVSTRNQQEMLPQADGRQGLRSENAQSLYYQAEPGATDMHHSEGVMISFMTGSLSGRISSAV